MYCGVLLRVIPVMNDLERPRGLPACACTCMIEYEFQHNKVSPKVSNPQLQWNLYISAELKYLREHIT